MFKKVPFLSDQVLVAGGAPGVTEHCRTHLHLCDYALVRAKHMLLAGAQMLDALTADAWEGERDGPQRPTRPRAAATLAAAWASSAPRTDRCLMTKPDATRRAPRRLRGGGQRLRRGSRGAR